tara:strand:+ start:1212 stop:1616 length:405 start_codon:yes stop_codon:yes gene_type:complete
MQRYEYKVVPAPTRGEKAKGAKTTPERFAVALMSVMNTQGAEGWEYLRADTLPCDERSGLTGTKTQFQNMLVFRKALPVAQAESRAFAPVHRDAPSSQPPQLVVVSEPVLEGHKNIRAQVDSVEFSVFPKDPPE